MRTQYEARPGTVAFRVLTHMQGLDKGAEISTGALGTQLGVDPNTLSGQLAFALRAGRIFMRQKGGHAHSPNFWSLVDHSKGVEVDAAQEQLAPAPTARWPHAFEASPSPSPAYPPLPDGDEFPEPGMQPHQVVTKVQPIAATSHQVHELEERTGEHRALKDSALPVLAYRSHTLDDSDQDAAPRVRKVQASDADSSIRETIAAIRETNPLQSVWAAPPATDTDETFEIDGDVYRVEAALAATSMTYRREFADGSSMVGDGIVSVLAPSEPEPKPEAPTISPTVAQSASMADIVRFGVWDDGQLHIQRGFKTDVLSKSEFTQLIAFLDSISLDVVRVGDVA